ncbi:MAG: M48 family metallopeptidase [Marinagarivorans sp.]|nr:M48 family metallopeptidase [Marinagarivorans sp.]
MNFFEHQSKARSRSTLLLALFIIAVACVVFFTALALAFVFGYFFEGTLGAQKIFTLDFWCIVLTSDVFVWSALGTFCLVVLGSVYKNLQLGGNGISVALSLNAKHVHPETYNLDYKKLLNVVTEMALASGQPVPKVFVLPDHTINAFAAGYNRHQTVVAVTEGALTQLSRDQLQGVIAHEFSHINFGDVKINMRLVALLHGILLIGELGRFIASMNNRGSLGSSNKNSNAKMAGFGFLIMAIGYSGTLFGNLIKAAVSRQREFLADASAVQFTRNPESIAGALKKISEGQQNISIEASDANLYNHFYFSALKPSYLNRWLATHPSLDERIARLGYVAEQHAKKPGLEVNNTHNTNTDGSINTYANKNLNNMGFAPQNSFESLSTPMTAQAIIESVGQPTAQHLANAKKDLQDLPEALKAATSDAQSARALIYALIIHYTPVQYHTAQMDYLNHNAHPNTFSTLQKIQPHTAHINANAAFNLLLMASPALQDQSAQQALHFKQCAKYLINADAKFTLFEWCIYRLAITPVSKKSLQLSNKRLSDCQHALSVLLYYTLSLSQPALRNSLLAKASATLKLTIPATTIVSIKQLDSAITQLRELKPLSKPLLLKALIECINGDGVVNDEELTLIRITALLLDCPIPDIHSAR